MRIEQRSAADERKVLIGMILDRQVLSRVASQWVQPGLFRTGWCNLVGQWAVDYLTQYDAPPTRDIETLYDSWAQKHDDKATIQLVGGFLDSLSEEYEQASTLNPEYLIDLAGRHFNLVRLERLVDDVQAETSAGRLDKALERVGGWNRLELGTGAGVDVLGDMEAIREAFETKSEPLIEFPGALGEFFGTTLERDGFIGFMGPDKRGKSFWLAEIAYRALLARRRVAFFEAGDLSQHQILRRLMCRVSRLPLEGNVTLSYPREISREKGSGSATVEAEDRYFESPLSWQQAWKAAQELMTKRVKSRDTLWKLSCHPNSTLTMNGLRSILAGWEREGWTPDVVIIDYADILGTDFPKLDERHQINKAWQQMRALSQSLHCLVVTASQTDSDAYKRNIITRTNFSEDKRKLAHVTGMIGLNQTPEEKDQGITRLNWVVRREGGFSETLCVHVAGHLGLANPAILSCW